MKSRVEEDRDAYRYRLLLGEVYEQAGQTAEAVKVYDEIIQDDGLQANGLEARSKKAFIELRAGNRPGAEKLINEVLKI